MDCRYIKENEIAEKFLREILTAQESAEYQKHLRTCEKCRKDLEVNELMIAGIRRMGKEEMRREIERQVQNRLPEEVSFNWGMILKIAAVLLFLVIAPGMIYYYQHFTPVPQEETKLSGKREEPAANEGFFTEQEAPLSPGDKELSEELRSGSVADRSTSKLGGEAFSKETSGPQKKSTAVRTNEIIEQERQSMPAEKQAESEPPAREKQMIEVVPGEKPVARSEKEEFDIAADESSLRNRSRTDKQMMPTGLSHTYSANKLKFDNRWNIESDQEKVVIYLQQSEWQQDQLNEYGYPKQFPVHIVKKDSSQLEMIWQVNEKIARMGQQNIIIPGRTKIFTIVLNQQLTYTIDLDTMNTQAVLIK
jgi:hypothetical protein